MVARRDGGVHRRRAHFVVEIQPLRNTPEHRHRGRDALDLGSPGRQQNYFTIIVLLFTPPKLLRTVTFCGFVDQVNWPLYFPPPLFVRLPIS